MAAPDTEIVGCGGRRVIPGIVDDHCHLFAAAAIRNAVDCRPSATPTVDTMVAALRAAPVRTDGWIRGHGYDDSPVGLGRHLTRHDLDSVSRRIPVRVDHRSGHATTLNSAGLAAIGITGDTADPPGSVIARDGSGQPTGLLLDMGSWLRERDGATHEYEPCGRRSAFSQLGRELLGYGITAVTDAGADNGWRQWQEFAGCAGGVDFPPRITMMAGCRRLDEMRDAGLTFGHVERAGMLRVGHAKIMLTASSGGLHPDPAALGEMIAAAHRMGYPVAIHAVERDAIVASALALADDRPPAGHDRIEHCAECPPDVADLVVSSGARVVLNTGFLHHDGERYLRTVPPDLLPHLYPVGALDAAGVSVALASDAPVVEPNPWAAMAAAITRRSAAGNPLGGVGLPSVVNALEKHTGGNRIAAGRPADLAVVDPDPLTVPVDRLPEVRSMLTLVGGRVAWRNGI